MSSGIERFLERVDKTSSPDGCWLWTGSRKPNGYPQFRADGHQYAHRFAYTVYHGHIPDGMEIDHTCHSHDGECAGGTACPHRSCVNPDHLEVVTRRENIYRSKNFTAYYARKTHCKNGHEFTPENTYTKPNGCRNCATCRAEADRRSYRRKLLAN